jgi:hypothetical protein
MLGPAQLVTWGILCYTFSLMLVPMQAELGWSTAELTGAFSLALLAGGFAALLALPGIPGLVLYIITLGVGHGAMTPMRATIVASAYPVSAYGSISGGLTFISTLLRSAAPVAASIAWRPLAVMSGCSPRRPWHHWRRQ